MHPYQHAAAHPDRVALAIADTGETLTYRELDEGSNRFAHRLRRLGLKPGDRIAVLLKNRLEFPMAYWGAQRAGLLAAMISTHLKPEEAAYIINDCGAKLLVTAAEIGETAAALGARRAELIPQDKTVFSAGDAPIEGATPLDAALADMPATPVADEVSGYYLVYSSGTTGRPKGVALPFTPGPIEEATANESGMMFPDVEPLAVMAPGPLYHSAPLVQMMAAHRRGATAVTLKKFDAAQALKAIQDWRVAFIQVVPTMFVRMLALPDEVRKSFDLSSLQVVMHAAAPCPVEIKRRMMDWLGPIIHEYYAASEAVGSTHITPEEWLARPGSVGRPRTGAVHICDEDGRELPPGESGLIYFEDPGKAKFHYLNDEAKTARARHPQHPDWYAVGDIGRVDEDGFLFLTDRKDFMIISGGVNIYPQAVEDALIVHPKVLDAAVIGVPHPEYGEEVKAIVQPKAWADAGPDLESELIDWCRARISAVSCPRSVAFVEELPRIPSGKLAKHELKRLFGAAPSPHPAAT
jgi:long-chain acyl-CoA synthetase